MAEEQTHFEIIECENHMPVAIRQFDSEEETMEYLNMRSNQNSHPIHPNAMRHRNPRGRRHRGCMNSQNSSASNPFCACWK